jgi:AraC family transcriptional regulator
MPLVSEPFLARVSPRHGVAPHDSLLARRVEAAKQKLRDDRLTLSDVAQACGFADQNRLTPTHTLIS